MTNPDHVEAVQAMQDYIDAHLTEPITLQALARCCGYSPWHCAKLFRELAGKTPFEYIRLRRLSDAALVLRDSDMKIVDAAMQFMFDSHEGFTRAFKKRFSLSPLAYKKSTPPVPLFTPWSVADSCYFYDNDTALSGAERVPGDTPLSRDEPLSGAFFVHISDFPARKLLLKRASTAADYFSFCDDVGCDVWGLLCSVKEALGEPAGYWMPESMRPEGTSVYVQGVEVPADYAGVIPDGLEIADLDACTMLFFQGETFDDRRFGEAVDVLQNAIRTYSPEQDGYRWADDDAPRFQLIPEGWRGYIEARPVRPL